MSTERGNDRLQRTHPLAPKLRFAVSSASSNLFFLKTPDGNLPVRSMKETTLCKRETEITRLDLLVDWPEKYFSGQSGGRISTRLELVW